jgi:chromosome segregation ATPase
MQIHETMRNALEKVQSSSFLQSQKIQQLEDHLRDTNIEHYKDQIVQLQNNLCSTQAELVAEKIERDSAIKQQETQRETMKAAVQRSKRLEQEVEELKKSVTTNESNNLYKKKYQIDNAWADERIHLENEIKMQKIAIQTKERAIETLNEKAISDLI